MTENLAGRGEGLAGLVDWLREQSEELMKSAIARESTAETMRGATPKELREAKALAEKMAGRKLPNVSTDSEEAKIEADVQCRIAAKLSDRARQIAAWADELAALEAAAPPSTAQDELLCVSCGHSYAQHTKGINHPQKYCRHCPCLEWAALATPSPQPSGDRTFSPTEQTPSSMATASLHLDAAKASLLRQRISFELMRGYQENTTTVEKIAQFIEADLGFWPQEPAGSGATPSWTQIIEEGLAALVGSPRKVGEDGPATVRAITEEEWGKIYVSEVVEATDESTRLAHRIVYAFASKRHGDLFQNENFVKAVRDVRAELAARPSSAPGGQK